MLVMRLEVGEAGREGRRGAALLEAEGGSVHITQASLGQINIYFSDEGTDTQVRIIKGQQKDVKNGNRT